MFNSFVEGLFLWAAFLIFIVGILTRVLFFLWAVIMVERPKKIAGPNLYAILGRSLIPFHIGARKKPFYAALRYLFHICLFVVPVWLAGHVALWSESRFGWEWSPLPDNLADWLTLMALCLAAYFFIRRLTVTEIRRQTNPSDFLLLVIVVLPFLTGYFLVHGTLDSVEFLGENMRGIHVLSGEVMLITAAFLFCRTRLNGLKCTGCASCESSCPTGTLFFHDEENIRTFFYSIYRCICCGSCVKVCPEEAAELRHEISVREFLRLFSSERMHSVKLAVCQRCGALFSTEPLLSSIEEAITDDYRYFCSNCKKTRLAIDFHTLAPWEKALQERPKGDNASTVAEQIS